MVLTVAVWSAVYLTSLHKTPCVNMPGWWTWQGEMDLQAMEIHYSIISPLQSEGPDPAESYDFSAGVGVGVVLETGLNCHARQHLKIMLNRVTG